MPKPKSKNNVYIRIISIILIGVFLWTNTAYSALPVKSTLRTPLINSDKQEANRQTVSTLLSWISYRLKELKAEGKDVESRDDLTGKDTLTNEYLDKRENEDGIAVYVDKDKVWITSPMLPSDIAEIERFLSESPENEVIFRRITDLKPTIMKDKIPQEIRNALVVSAEEGDTVTLLAKRDASTGEIYSIVEPAMYSMLDRREFIKKTSKATAGIALLDPVSALLRAGQPLSLEQKLEVAKKSIANIQHIINLARTRQIPIELTELWSSDGKIKDDLRREFKRLKQVGSLFIDKDTLNNLMGFIGEDNYYSMFVILRKLDMDIPEIGNTLGEISREDTPAGILAKELFINIEIIKKERERVLRKREVVLRKPRLVLEYSKKIVNWLMHIIEVLYSDPHEANLDKRLIKVFNVPGDDPAVYAQARNDSMRMVLKEGASGYDFGLAAMVLAINGNIEQAKKLAKVYWSGATLQLRSICSNWGGYNDYERPFNYYDKNPSVIGRDNNYRGTRGWPFKLISEYYLVVLPDGREVVWDQWQPICGEAAWIGMGILQTYYQEHGREYLEDDVAIKLVKEIVRAAMILQKDKENQGAPLQPVPMSPRGTWHENEPEWDPFKMRFLNDEVSLENNLSLFALDRMLLEIVGDYQVELPDGEVLMLSTYKQRIEDFFRWAYDPIKHEFPQGFHFDGQQWVKNDVFATDVQLWAVLILGPEWFDDEYGPGETYRLLERTIEKAGIMDGDGRLVGFDYSDKKNKKSAEWSRFGDPVLRAGATYYRKHSEIDPNTGIWRERLMGRAVELVNGIQHLKKETDNMIAWRYSDKPGEFIEHGWYIPPGEDTEHNAPAAWDALDNHEDDQGNKGFYSPVVLGGALGKIDPITGVEIRTEDRIKSSDEIATLHQNYPNPFTDKTTIRYTLNEWVSNARLEIFNIKGELVKTFGDVETSTGDYITINRYIWDGTDNYGKRVSGGDYIIRLSFTRDKDKKYHQYTIKAIYLPVLRMGIGVGELELGVGYELLRRAIQLLQRGL